MKNDKPFKICPSIYYKQRYNKENTFVTFIKNSFCFLEEIRVEFNKQSTQARVTDTTMLINL